MKSKCLWVFKHTHTHANTHAYSSRTKNKNNVMHQTVVAVLDVRLCSFTCKLMFFQQLLIITRWKFIHWLFCCYLNSVKHNWRVFFLIFWQKGVKWNVKAIISIFAQQLLELSGYSTELHISNYTVRIRVSIS